MTKFRPALVILAIVSMLIMSVGAAQQPYAGREVRIGCQSSQWCDVYKELAPEFTAETGIRVLFEDIPFGTMYEVLKTHFVAGASPYDMIWYDSMWTPEFSQEGWIRDLAPYLSDSYLAPSEFGYPDEFYGVWYSGRYEQQHADQWRVPVPEGSFGIPWVAGFRPLYYRTDLLSEAGFTDASGEPKPPETLDELLEQAQAMHNPDENVYGFVMPAGRPRLAYDWSQYLWTFGGDFFDQDFEPIFNSPEGLEALEYYMELVALAPPGVGAYHITEAWTSYMQGNAVFAWTWQDLASVAREDSEIIGKFATAAPPTHEGRRHPLIGGIVASITSDARNPEPAFKFISWSQTEEMAKRATLMGATGLRRSVWDDPDVEEMYPSAVGDIPQLSMETALTVPLIPEWPAVDQIVAEQLSLALVGQKAPQQALDDAAAEVEALMRRAGYYD